MISAANCNRCFEKLLDLETFHTNLANYYYVGVFWAANNKSEIGFSKKEMTDPIWRTCF